MNRRYPTVLSLAIALLLGVSASAGADILTDEATLNAAQEVPPTGSSATGSAVIVIDTDANTLDYNITFSGLEGTETAAHIHGFAAPGFEAGPVHTLPAGSPKIGTWNYTEDQEASILDELTYINIHSTEESDGEIRGQVVESQGVPVEPTTWGRIKQLMEL